MLFTIVVIMIIIIVVIFIIIIIITVIKKPDGQPALAFPFIDVVHHHVSAEPKVGHLGIDVCDDDDN